MSTIETELAGVTFQLTPVEPGRFQSRAQSRKGFRGSVINRENGAVVQVGSTWRAADGRWYPGHIGTSRKKGPGHETPEACLLEQFRWSTERYERDARANARNLIHHTNNTNELRAVLGLDPLTVDGLLADVREENR